MSYAVLFLEDIQKESRKSIAQEDIQPGSEYKNIKTE
jgi:hypothetical protein